MMQRLRDLKDPVEPEYAQAREFLRQVEPLPQSPAQAERVLAAIRLRGPAPATPPTPLLTKAVLAGLALGAAVALAVALSLLRSPVPVLSPPAPPPPPSAYPVEPIPIAELPALRPPTDPAPRIASPSRPGPGVRAPRQAVVSPPTHAVPTPQPEGPAAPTAAPPVEPLAPPAPPPAAPVEVTDSADPEEAALVLSAIQAQRQHHKPASALTLLSEYQRRFPAGALQEEALALRLECLVALADWHAVESAREYLARYPRGRFQRFASAVIAREGGAAAAKGSP